MSVLTLSLGFFCTPSRPSAYSLVFLFLPFLPPSLPLSVYLSLPPSSSFPPSLPPLLVPPFLTRGAIEALELVTEQANHPASAVCSERLKPPVDDTTRPARVFIFGVFKTSAKKKNITRRGGRGTDFHKLYKKSCQVLGIKTKQCTVPRTVRAAQAPDLIVLCRSSLSPKRLRMFWIPLDFLCFLVTPYTSKGKRHAGC